MPRETREPESLVVGFHFDAGKETFDAMTAYLCVRCCICAALQERRAVAGVQFDRQVNVAR